MQISSSRREAREAGLAEGRAEEKKALARKFKEAGVSIELIAQSTGLSMEEIAAL